MPVPKHSICACRSVWNQLAEGVQDSWGLINQFWKVADDESVWSLSGECLEVGLMGKDRRGTASEASVVQRCVGWGKGEVSLLYGTAEERVNFHFEIVLLRDRDEVK